MEDRIARTILTTILIGITSLFLFEFCSIKLQNERLRNDCTKEVIATIRGIETRMESDGELNTAPTVYQKPTFVFMLNGEEEKVTEENFKVYGYTEGQNVTLMVNPENPEEFYHKAYLTDLLAYAFLGAAFLMVVCVIELKANSGKRTYVRRRAREPIEIYRENGYRYLKKKH